jgi:hypothetical protein
MNRVQRRYLDATSAGTWASAIADENDNRSILTAAGNWSLVKSALSPRHDALGGPP